MTEKHALEPVVPLRRPRGFVDFLREQAKRRGMTAVELAQRVGVHRARMQQIMVALGPPPVPEIVSRIAIELQLGEVERHTLSWLGLRDGADANVRRLLEGYEEMLARDDRPAIPRVELPSRIGHLIDAASFGSAKRELAIRRSTKPIHVLAHDERGRMANSLQDGWLVRVEPFGMYGPDEFLARARNCVVLMNHQRRCRIGWLRQRSRRWELDDDSGQPLLQDWSGSATRIHLRSGAEPNVTRLQGFILPQTLEEVRKMRERLRHQKAERDWSCLP